MGSQWVVQRGKEKEKKESEVGSVSPNASGPDLLVLHTQHSQQEACGPPRASLLATVEKMDKSTVRKRAQWRQIPGARLHHHVVSCGGASSRRLDAPDPGGGCAVRAAVPATPAVGSRARASASVFLGEEGDEAQRDRHDAACHGPSSSLQIHHQTRSQSATY